MFDGGKNMFCKNCGKEIEDSAKFCKHCGASMNDNTAAIGNESVKQNAVTDSEVAVKKKSSKSLYFVALLLTLN